MKKILATLLLMGFVHFGAKADPPKSINVTMGTEGKRVIEVVHPVKDVLTHYIDLVEISLDGKVIKTFKFDKQSDAKAQTLDWKPEKAMAGQTISVKARCNRFGTKTVEVKL
jgi:desulfoferrodoxin (superoxide reductase-like protein)